MTHDDAPSRATLERARDDPENVAVPEIVSYLDTDDETIRKTAADVLYDVAADDPARLVETDAVSDLVGLLSDSNPLVRESAALALADVAEESDAVVPFAETIAAHLHDDYAIVADALAYALRNVATTAPGALEASVPRLAGNLDAELDSTRFHLLSALVGVATERPERVRPAVEPVLGVIDRRDPDIARLGGPDPSTSDGAEIQPPTGVESGIEPGQGIEAEPELGDHDSEDTEGWIVETALSVLATMAAERPARTAADLREYAPRLWPHLDDRHAGVRSVTAGLLAAIAEYEPGAVEPAIEGLADRLTDPATVVAGNAVWALRYLDTPRSRRLLRNADPNHDDVRAVLDAALADLEG